MKKLHVFALVLFFVFIISSLLAVIAFSMTGTRNLGEVKIEERTVADFDKVKFEGVGELYITEGNEEKLTIEANEDYLEIVEAEVKNGTLVLSENSWSVMRFNFTFLSTKRVLKYNLTVTDLSEIDLEGLGSITVEEINADTVKINLTGAGDIVIDEINADKVKLNIEGLGSLTVNNLYADSLEANLDGAGDIEILDGKVLSQVISLQGLGSFEAKDLTCSEADATLEGAGSIELYADTKLIATINGLGSIDYWGEAEVSSDIDGLGDISGH